MSILKTDEINPSKKKIIYDLLYGYIDVCSKTEQIVNHESFQRLKDIRQMTSFHLYPSANHTRFEHSLGVMYLGTLFFSKLRSQIQIIYTNEYNKKQKTCKSNIDYLSFSLKYSALLHDVGHAPLSHVGEKFFNLSEIKERLKEVLIQKKISLNVKSLTLGSNHEWMSCLVIAINFYDLLKEIALSFNTYFDLEFFIRIITGNLYIDSEYPELWDKNLIIQIINSEALDVDKLDYLMRDNLMTGKVGPEIDLQRLLESLIITKNKKLSFSKVGLSTIQKIIDCRDQLYLWVCNHHTVVYTDFIYEELFHHFSLLYNTDIPPLYINDKRLDLVNRVEILTDYYSKSNGFYRLKNSLLEEEKKVLTEKLNAIGYLPYEEAMDPSEFFSIEAVIDYKVTDSDVHSFLKTNKAKCLSTELSLYSKKLLSQLLNRNFLKPLWKTIFEYKNFMKDNIDQEISDDIIKYISDEKSGDARRRKLIKVILYETELMPGDVMLVVRPNKFYLTADIDKFYISLKKDMTIQLKELLPQKNYLEKYNKIAFYVYCPDDEEIRGKVMKSLVTNLNGYKNVFRKYKQFYK